MLSAEDWQALWLTFRLSATVTVLLLILSTPLAYWLANTRSRAKVAIAALVAMPLVLPPTVIGFYLLLAFSPRSGIGAMLSELGIGPLAFTFEGLVVASMVYSLPFVVQPIQNAMTTVGQRPVEAASLLGANRWQAFWRIIFPLARPGYIVGAVLGFAHTVGEFGIVLMIGGAIPGETRVVSVSIYDHVESLNYAAAHRLSAVVLVFSLLLLVTVYTWQARQRGGSTVPMVN